LLTPTPSNDHNKRKKKQEKHFFGDASPAFGGERVISIIKPLEALELQEQLEHQVP
jgi:hypothetical protein